MREPGGGPVFSSILRGLFKWALGESATEGRASSIKSFQTWFFVGNPRTVLRTVRCDRDRQPTDRRNFSPSF